MAAAAIQIPAGGTYLDTFKQSFTNVPVDAANDNVISTEEFLEAAESLVTIFGELPTNRDAIDTVPAGYFGTGS